MSVGEEAWLPYPRSWVTKENSTISAASTPFSVMTYNILCDLAALRNPGYSYVKPGYLKMVDRHPNIVEEVKQQNPSILCLQEVENDHLEQRLIPDLRRLGYECATGRTDLKEGPSTFFKSEMYSLEESERYRTSKTFMDMLSKYEDTLSPDVVEAAKKYLDQNREFVVSKFQCKDSKKIITVANIHCLWGSFECATIQTTEVIAALQYLFMASGGADTRFILTGDFNSTPSYPPYLFLQDGAVSKDTMAAWPDRKGFSPLSAKGHNCSLQELVPELFRHDVPLKNAYTELTGQNPDATNCDPLGGGDNPIYIGCLDYIWYNHKTLACEGVVSTPPGDVLKSEVGLPNTRFPSDHIYLMAKFQ